MHFKAFSLVIGSSYSLKNVSFLLIFSLQKAEYINSKICDTHLVFLRHKKQRDLPSEESFGHNADR